MAGAEREESMNAETVATQTAQRLAGPNWRWERDYLRFPERFSLLSPLLAQIGHRFSPGNPI
jgi:hypothetical protein